jgi:hypothetical protein
MFKKNVNDTHEALVAVGDLVVRSPAHHQLRGLLASGQVHLHTKQTPLLLSRLLAL